MSSRETLLLLMEVSEGCEDIGMREDYKLLVQILLFVILRFLNRVARYDV